MEPEGRALAISSRPYLPASLTAHAVAEAKDAAAAIHANANHERLAIHWYGDHQPVSGHTQRRSFQPTVTV